LPGRLLTGIVAALLVCCCVPAAEAAAPVPPDETVIGWVETALAEISEIHRDRAPLIDELDQIEGELARGETRALLDRHAAAMIAIHATFGPERVALVRLVQVLPTLEARIRLRESELAELERRAGDGDIAWQEEVAYASRLLPLMRQVAEQARKLVTGGLFEDPEDAFFRSRSAGDGPAAVPAGGDKGGLPDEDEPPAPEPEPEPEEHPEPADDAERFDTQADAARALVARRDAAVAAWQALYDDPAASAASVLEAADRATEADARLARLAAGLVAESLARVAELDRQRRALLDAADRPDDDRAVAAGALAAVTIETTLAMAIRVTEAAGIATGDQFLMNQAITLGELTGTLRPDAPGLAELDDPADATLLERVEDCFGVVVTACDSKGALEAQLGAEPARRAELEAAIGVTTLSIQAARAEIQARLDELDERARRWARRAGVLAAQPGPDAAAQATAASAWGEQLAARVAAFRLAFEQLPGAEPPSLTPPPSLEETDPPDLERAERRDFLIKVAHLSPDVVDAMTDEELARRVLEEQTGGKPLATLADVADLIIAGMRPAPGAGLIATPPPPPPVQPEGPVDDSIRARFRRQRAELRLERRRLRRLLNDEAASHAQVEAARAGVDRRERQLTADVGELVDSADTAVRGLDRERFRARLATLHPGSPTAASVLARAQARIDADAGAVARLVRVAADVSGRPHLKGQADLLDDEGTQLPAALPGLWTRPEDPAAGLAVPIPPPAPAPDGALQPPDSLQLSVTAGPMGGLLSVR
jgi:hypothetical protein